MLSNTYDTRSGLSDMMLIKLTDDTFQASGDPVFLGGDGEDTAAAVGETTDGRIIVLGTISVGSPASQTKIVLMKLIPMGDWPIRSDFSLEKGLLLELYSDLI